MKTLALRPAAERREVFSATATAMAITPAAAEKDFWLCWVLMQVAEDPHTINIHYPAEFAAGYLRPQIRLEIGALASMMPMGIYSVTPYAAEKFPQLFVQPSIKVSAIKPERTFWEKLTILHAEAHRPETKPIPPRYSRHYYDAYQFAINPSVNHALGELSMLQQVVEFKQRFYPSGWANYETAVAGTFKLTPSEHHLLKLKQDYQEMGEMIFGKKPTFENMLETLAAVEQQINARKEEDAQ